MLERGSSALLDGASLLRLVDTLGSRVLWKVHADLRIVSDIDPPEPGVEMEQHNARFVLAVDSGSVMDLAEKLDIYNTGRAIPGKIRVEREEEIIFIG